VARYGAHVRRHLGDGGALGAGVAPPEPASVSVGVRRKTAADDVARAEARSSLRRDFSQPPFPNIYLLGPLDTIVESCGINQR
jgi:hypothetical protein